MSAKKNTAESGNSRAVHRLISYFYFSRLFRIVQEENMKYNGL